MIGEIFASLFFIAVALSTAHEAVMFYFSRRSYPQDWKIMAAFSFAAMCMAFVPWIPYLEGG